MTTRIGLISDTHSTSAPLKEAIALFQKENVDKIICAGDIAGYGEDELQETIDILLKNNCLMISGNHDVELTDIDRASMSNEVQQFLSTLPRKLEFTIEDINIYVAHASPPDNLHGGIKLLDQTGRLIPENKTLWKEKLASLNCDVLVVGHSHQVFAEKLGNILVLNPGSTCFNHSCMVLSLPDMKVKIFGLSGKKILRTWNWGLFYKDHPEKISPKNV